MDGKLLTLDQAAAHLGVTYRTVFRWHRAKLLRTFKIGRVVRVSPEELASFIARNTSEAVTADFKETAIPEPAPVKAVPRRRKKAGVGPGLAFLRKFDAGK